MSDLEEFLRRKRDIDRKKAKVHLTELDAELLFTNADEFTFRDGETIIKEGQMVNTVYRLKKGRAKIVKAGKTLTFLEQGWFLNERILLLGDSVAPFSFVAVGDVTIVAMDLDYVKKLFSIDQLLAIKFYRNLAVKLSSYYYLLMGTVVGVPKEKIPFLRASTSVKDTVCCAPKLEPSQGLFLDAEFTCPENNNNASNTASSGITAGTSGFFPPQKKKSSKQLKKLNRRRSVTLNGHQPYRVYALDSAKGILTCKLKRNKVKIVSELFGFTKKKSIRFRDVKDIARLNENSITLIYVHKGTKRGTTLFLKVPSETDELFGYIKSVVEQHSVKSQRHQSIGPVSTVGYAGSSLESSTGSTHSASSSSSSSNDSHNEDNLRDKSIVRNVSELSALTLSNSSASEGQNEDVSCSSCPCEEENEDLKFQKIDKEYLESLSQTLSFRKGEVVIHEGDLFQRLYHITEGTLQISQEGRSLITLNKGDTFGETTILHLRPSVVKISVTSDNAEIRMIPGYKLNEMMYKNDAMSVRIYKKVARLLDMRIQRIFSSHHKGQPLVPAACITTAEGRGISVQ
eukprot:TRINITY_DN2981_c0_g1_i1.p1 TRINITY_DN2981_c0_g1~~TRINITY_DN2981_c0_g1_i1.p1  ORF type:complete len:571 (-),score=157.34 TRINITY_DN2981_c0_g1_i1:132-1844(-)